MISRVFLKTKKMKVLARPWKIQKIPEKEKQNLVEWKK